VRIEEIDDLRIFPPLNGLKVLGRADLLLPSHCSTRQVYQLQIIVDNLMTENMGVKVHVNNGFTTILEPFFLESLENSSLFREYLF